MADKENKTSKGQYLSIGLALGVMVGVAMDNIPIGICIGLALGTAYSANEKKKENKRIRSKGLILLPDLTLGALLVKRPSPLPEAGD